MKAKKIISLIIIGVGTLSLLAGCGSNTNSNQAGGTQQETQNEEQITADTGDSMMQK